MNLWHLTSDAPRHPERPCPGQAVELWVGTWPIETSQRVDLACHVLGRDGRHEAHEVEASWDHNQGPNSYWCARVGPFADGDVVDYHVTGRRGLGTVMHAGGSFRVGPKFHLALLWHQHQPSYLEYDGPCEIYRFPWVRLHAIRDYYAMAALVAEYPAVHLTINLVPSLLAQIEGYCERGAVDQALLLTQTPAARLSDAERGAALSMFFDADWHNQIYVHAHHARNDSMRHRQARVAEVWMSNQATLQFLGGVGTVTGSKYLLTVAGRRVLLDCGLLQGLKELRLRWQAPPFDPAGIDAVVLSHAHLDHSGYLPLLVRRGFRGPILCTPGTEELLPVLLLDAAHLQEEEAERANRYGYSKHKPALPLYTTADAEAALRQTASRPYGERFPVIVGLSALFRRAGHILSSATVDLEIGGKPKRLAFSGDLGRWNRPILRDPERVPKADILLVESTYGDRTHAPDAAGALAALVRDAVAWDGALIVPAFAVGRTQELIWTRRHLEESGAIPSLPVFVDSPMAINVSDIYCQHPEDHNLDMQLLMDEHRCPICCKQYTLVRTAVESKALNDRRGPMIIISASGMATGGGVLHHLALRLPDERTTVLLPGFQAAGTRGRALQEGARELRIYGQSVPVRAHVVTRDGFSAHADRSEILRWASGFERPPAQVYVVHGEPQSSRALSESLRATLGWNSMVAKDGQTIELEH